MIDLSAYQSYLLRASQSLKIARCVNYHSFAQGIRIQSLSNVELKSAIISCFFTVDFRCSPAQLLGRSL